MYFTYTPQHLSRLFWPLSYFQVFLICSFDYTIKKCMQIDTWGKPPVARYVNYQKCSGLKPYDAIKSLQNWDFKHTISSFASSCLIDMSGNTVYKERATNLKHLSKVSIFYNVGCLFNFVNGIHPNAYKKTNFHKHVIAFFYVAFENIDQRLISPWHTNLWLPIIKNLYASAVEWLTHLVKLVNMLSYK